ncbi:MAG TPA: hypothetical protein VNB64_02955 [Solirubrobacteraceae bacterium]|nr:hypothetical protein [Solirubrobacteraceae bacterium]
MAATTTLRVRPETRDRLNRLAREDRVTAPELIDRLVQKEEQHRLLLGMNEDFARLRRDPDAWAGFEAEIDAWETASAPVDADSGTPG